MPINAFEILTDWNKVPLVRLSQLIQAEPWFQGTCSLNMTEEEWKDDNHKLWPSFLYITPIHRNVKLNDIYIRLSDEDSKFHIDVSGQRRRKNTDMPRIPERTASTYLRVIQKVREAVEILKQYKDPEIDKMEADARQEAHQKQEIQNTLDQLGLDSITKDRYSSSELSYRQGEPYGLSFYVQAREGKETVYNIAAIRGRFTLEELKRIMEFVGTCPSAVADKLLKG